jgi:hypothetical protein
MAKYYKVDRFLKVQKVDEANKDKVEADWVEVNKDGSPLKESSDKKKSK